MLGERVINGQLGTSSETYYVEDDDEYFGYDRDAPLPVLVEDGGIPLSGVLEIVGGAVHTCALLEDSGVKCWGWELSGRLGNGEVGFTLDEYDTKYLRRRNIFLWMFLKLRKGPLLPESRNWLLIKKGLASSLTREEELTAGVLVKTAD